MLLLEGILHAQWGVPGRDSWTGNSPSTLTKPLEAKGGGWGEGCDGWRGPSSVLIHLLVSITGRGCM